MEKVQLTHNTIEQQDCVSGMRELPQGSVDLIFADPPFNIGYKYDVYQDKLEAEHYLDWSREWISAAHGALKDTGAFWLAIGDEYAAELKIISQEVGFHCRSWVIWYYTFGVNCKNKFTRSHAHLFHFVKNEADYTFRADDPANRIPSARQLVYNDKRANPKGRLPDDTWIIPPADATSQLQISEPHSVQKTFSFESSKKPSKKDKTPDTKNVLEKLPAIDDKSQTWTLRPQDVESCFSESEDTWHFPRVAGTFKERAGFHGCQMPEQLLGRIIRSCSEAGELVLDPFSGSATTLAVAKKLGRNYLGYDISEEYIQCGRKRLAEIFVGDRLVGSPEPAMSAPKTGEDKNKKAKGKASKKPAWNDPVERKKKQQQAQLELTYQGVKQAYEFAAIGSSVDCVVMDPEKNAAFVAACKHNSLAGDACTWNTMLFHLRQAGKLSEIESATDSILTWEQCDSFLPASEIAMQTLLQQKQAESLEEIFCDPLLAKKFDQLASEISPGFSPYQYRFAALKIRQQAAVAQSQGEILYNARAKQLKRMLGKKFSIDKIPKEIPQQPGVYLILNKQNKALYAGETYHLQQRLQLFADGSPNEYWQQFASQSPLFVQYCEVETESVCELAWQHCLAKKYQPQLNYHQP